MDTITQLKLANISISDNKDIEMLLEAANDLRNASEGDFNHMKDKKWHKRLWEVITFSKDGQKVVAKNIASLAKMQDIVIRALLIVSAENPKILDRIETHIDLTSNLRDALAKMKYGHDSRPSIQDMQIEYQYILVSALRKFVDTSHPDSAVPCLAQDYLHSLQRCCASSLNPDNEGFNYEKIKDLNADGHKLLAITLCEMEILLDDSPQRDAAFEGMRKFVGVSIIVFDDIKSKAQKDAKLLGKEGIATRYNGIILDDILTIDAVGMEFEEVDESRSDSNNDWESFTLPADDTAEQLPLLRDTILKHIPRISTDKNYISKDECEKHFIDKYTPHMTKETVVALVNTFIVGPVLKGVFDTAGILFTTHALYYVSHWQLSHKAIQIKYKDIDYEKCELIRDKNSKASGLIVAIKGASAITIKDYINHDALIDAINDIGRLSEFAPADAPQPIADMDYAVKLPFVKIMINLMMESEYTYIELMRYACDIGFTDEQLSELAQYIASSRSLEKELLSQIDSNAPYGSRKSLRYALITEMYSQLQFAKYSSNNEITKEREFIRKIATKYEFDNNAITKLRIVGQTKFKVLIGEKNEKGFSESEKALKDLAASGGVTLATIIGTGFMLWKASWLILIPSIGAIFVAGLASHILIQKVKFRTLRKDMIASEKESYQLAIERIVRLFPGMTEEIAILKKHLSQLTSNA